MDSQTIDFQLTPAELHRRNNAERAIQTFKPHFKAGLVSTPHNFSLNLWDKILPQVLLTLNILRPSRINPWLSTYANAHGAFDYKRTPLAPLSINCMAHVKSSLRNSWDPNAKAGFYIGPAMKARICDTVK